MRCVWSRLEIAWRRLSHSGACRAREAAYASRRSGAAQVLDEAAALAGETGEAQRLIPVTAARAEAAWTAGKLDDLIPTCGRLRALACRPVRAWQAKPALLGSWEAGALTRRAARVRAALF
jgi:hypothetical protein